MAAAGRCRRASPCALATAEGALGARAVAGSPVREEGGRLRSVTAFARKAAQPRWSPRSLRVPQACGPRALLRRGGRGSFTPPAVPVAQPGVCVDGRGTCRAVARGLRLPPPRTRVDRGVHGATRGPRVPHAFAVSSVSAGLSTPAKTPRPRSVACPSWPRPRQRSPHRGPPVWPSRGRAPVPPLTPRRRTAAGAICSERERRASGLRGQRCVSCCGETRAHCQSRGPQARTRPLRLLTFLRGRRRVARTRGASPLFRGTSE